MVYVEIQPIDAVIGGDEITVPLTYVELIDSVTGFNGEGSYHIQLTSSGTYLVTYGLAPGDSASLMTIGRVMMTGNGSLSFADKRKLNVGWTGVNATIMQTPVGGSYLASGCVTNRVLSGGISGILDNLGSVEGDILYRGASGWTVLAPGTAGYVLATGGSGAAPSWVSASGSGPAIVPSGTSFPGSPTTDQLFYRTDLNAMFWYNGTGWKNVDSLAQLNDVSLSSLANQQLLYYNSGSGQWNNILLSALLDAVFGSTRGAILERGASGWTLVTPGTSGDVFTSNGSGADPSWQAGYTAPTTGSCAESQVAVSTSAVLLLASNASRIGATIYNKSAASLYVGTSSSTTLSLFTDIIGPNSYWTLPVEYSGTLYGIWDHADATGQANIAAFPS